MGTGKTWVVGEVLIDLLKTKDFKQEVVGGGPANSALSLANLRLPVSFICGISSDSYGKLIEKKFLSVGIELDLAYRSDLPTAFAIVNLEDENSAKYEFRIKDTATFEFYRSLPTGEPQVLYIGSLATVVEPTASELLRWAGKLQCVIVFDPNVRPSILGDQNRYRYYFEKWLGVSRVVKLSDEDLSWLGYSVNEILAFGVELVVVTHGKNGISGFRKNENIRVPAVKTDVIDTVGAGDTVGAIVVEGLINLIDLEGKNLKFTLERAARAAAITCSRSGAIPPTFAELI